MVVGWTLADSERGHRNVVKFMGWKDTQGQVRGDWWGGLREAIAAEEGFTECHAWEVLRRLDLSVELDDDGGVGGGGRKKGLRSRAGAGAGDRNHGDAEGEARWERRVKHLSATRNLCRALGLGSSCQRCQT
ncbi:unnamed protein product, partial [Discosporangium mesarthrocarpum]